MKNAEYQDVTLAYVRLVMDIVTFFIYEREAIKSVGELPMNFTKLR